MTKQRPDTSLLRIDPRCVSDSFKDRAHIEMVHARTRAKRTLDPTFNWKREDGLCKGCLRPYDECTDGCQQCKTRHAVRKHEAKRKLLARLERLDALI